MMKTLSLLLPALLITSCASAPIERTATPFDANNLCPTFKPKYEQCEVLFGNKGLSVLNSFYETFVGEGAFEIYGFNVQDGDTVGYRIAAESNRGDIVTEIIPDRVVRISQDREDEEVFITHQGSYCDAGRIYQHQVTYMGDEVTVQDLMFRPDGDRFIFVLYQDGSKTAEVQCT